MATGTGGGSPTEVLRRDHARLAALLDDLLDAFRRGDREALRDAWSRFEQGLLAHLETEERHVLPRIARVAPAEAEAIASEHEALRSRLEDLGVGVDLHAVSLGAAEELAVTLRAHALREERLLYRLADEELDGPSRLALEQGLSGRKRP